MSVCGYPADDLFVYCGSCMTVHSYSYSFHLEFPFSSIYGCGAGHYKLIDKPYEVNTEIEWISFKNLVFWFLSTSLLLDYIGWGMWNRIFK